MSQIFSLKLSNGWLIFYVRYKQTTIVEIYNILQLQVFFGNNWQQQCSTQQQKILLNLFSG